MNSNDQLNLTIQERDLCEIKIDPAAKIFDSGIFLCPACFHYKELMPEIVAKSVERFLIGNFV